MNVSIEECARCGLNHKSLDFNELTNAGEWTHWVMCPETNQPILLKILLDVEDFKK